MNTKEIRDALLSQFSEPSFNPYPSRPRYVVKKRKTLAEFYQEVFLESTPLNDTRTLYEFELMMMENRKLIEAKNKKR